MLIILAPHLIYPLRNGGDIYIERLGCYLSGSRGRVVILGTNTVTVYEFGLMINQDQFSNKVRTKTWAAIRTLLFKSHYLVEKFLTTAYHQKAKELVQKYPQALVVYSLISTSYLDLSDKLSIVITQNDEVAVYKNQQTIASNPLHKIVAAYSEKWLVNFLFHSSQKYIYAHITEADQNTYSSYISDHKSILVPAGVEYRPPSRTSRWERNKIHLLFCGSLNVKMNFDALCFFKRKYWHQLKQHFQEDIDLWVAGSHPTSSVINLCINQGWILYPDISDDELDLLYDKATFGVLPFEYSAGAKIKLLNNLAAGLPVLATTNVKTIPAQDFLPNLFSDEPIAWLTHLEKYQATSYAISGRIACQSFAMQYSWQKIAENMDRDLKALGI